MNQHDKYLLSTMSQAIYNLKVIARTHTTNTQTHTPHRTECSACTTTTAREDEVGED